MSFQRQVALMMQAAGGGPPPAGGLVFWANTPDDSTYEMLGVKDGVGGLTEARAYQIQVPNDQGVYVTVPGGQPAWAGARWDGGVAYADNGGGVLLDPLPTLVHAPQDTNYIPYSRDFNNWMPSANMVAVFNEVGIDGASVPIRAEDDSTFNTEIAYLYADVSGYTGDVSLVSWVKKETLSGAFSALRFTFSAANDLSVGTAPRVVVLLDQASGLYQVNASSYPIDGLVVDMIDEGDFWRVVATAPNTDGFAYCGYAIYPAFTDVWGSTALDSSAIGSIAMDGFMALRTSHEHAKVALPIYTSGVPATRDACDLQFDIANHDNARGAWMVEAEVLSPVSATMALLGFRSASPSIINPRDGNTDVRSTNDAFFTEITGIDVTLAKKFAVAYDAAADKMVLVVDGFDSTVVSYSEFIVSSDIRLAYNSAEAVRFGPIMRYDAPYDEAKQIIDSWMAE